MPSRNSRKASKDPKTPEKTKFDAMHSALRISRASVNSGNPKSKNKNEIYEEINRDIRPVIEHDSNNEEVKFKPLHVQEMVIQNEDNQYAFITELKPETSRNKRTKRLSIDQPKDESKHKQSRHTTKQGNRRYLGRDKGKDEFDKPLASSMISDNQYLDLGG